MIMGTPTSNHAVTRLTLLIAHILVPFTLRYEYKIYL